MGSDTRLIVFLKVPSPGRVKTRLAVSVGPDEACRIYRELVDDLLQVLGDLTDLELRVAPASEIDSCQGWCQPTWRLRPQSEGDLGQRLLDACKTAFSEGVEQVLLIGSDCPYIGPEEIGGAQRALETNDVVLGPARDGGYWLLGMNRLMPELFESIEWSTERVLQQTVCRAESVGAKVALLSELEDVDDLAGWERYQKTKK